ncbi:MAG: YqjF family protein, partial [Terriglobia bacterium]
VSPLRMSGVRPRWAPALPGLSAFPELNVRTYVCFEGKPGVFFFSLDAGNRLAVEVARRWYWLPYFHARMRIEKRGQWFEYESRRVGSEAEFVGRYRPTNGRGAGKAQKGPAPGTLVQWLVERYCLYTVDARGRVGRGEIHHRPWSLQPAQAEIDRNTLTAPLGLELRGAPLLHYAEELEVVVWPLRRVA